MMKIRQQQRNMKTAKQDTNGNKQIDVATRIIDFRRKMPARRYDILTGSYRQFPPTLSAQNFGMTLQIGQRHFLQCLPFTNKPQPSHTTGITQYTRAAPSRLHVRFTHLELQSIIFLHISHPSPPQKGKVWNQNFTQYSGHETEKSLVHMPHTHVAKIHLYCHNMLLIQNVETVQNDWPSTFKNERHWCQP